MSKKTFALVTGILGAVSAATTAIVSFFQPPFMPAIIASIGVVVTATNEILSLFTKQDTPNEKTK